MDTVYKGSIGHIAPHFTMKRQLDDYIARFYTPEARRAATLKADNYREARNIVAWKEEVASKWDQIQVLSAHINDAELGASPRAGAELVATCTIDTKGLGRSIGVELVVNKMSDGERVLQVLSKCLFLQKWQHTDLRMPPQTA